MAYKFGYKAPHGECPGESLDDFPDYKNQIDSLILGSHNITMVGWRLDGGYTLDDGTQITVNHYDTFQYFLDHDISPVYLIEIFEGNVQKFDFDKVIVKHGDILNYKNLIPEYHRDTIVWQDGPEHMEMHLSKMIIQDMQASYRNIVIATPYGLSPQPALYNNPYEAHQSTWFERDYEELGFEWCKYTNESIMGYWTQYE